MGYMTFSGVCFGCKRVFSYHPNKVPSIPIKDGKPHPDGEKMPICKECVDAVNPIREARGLPPITYEKDAYKIVHDEEKENIDWEE